MKILDAYSEEVWEQRRYEIAKDMFVRYVGEQEITTEDEFQRKGENIEQHIARLSVQYADALIAELKKEGE